MNESLFSLVLCTTDRLLYVEKFLNSLARQEFKNFQLILGYNQEQDTLFQGLISGYCATFPIINVPYSHCGISRARNICLPLATGQYIAFPDDDCQYYPDTLSECLRIFDEFPQAGAILGSDTSGGIKSAAGSKTKSVNRYNAFSGSQTYLQFYRAECVARVGGFDENLGWGTGLPYGCGEDTDYVLRILAQGFTVIRAPNVKVFHPPVNLNDPDLPLKTSRYAHGRMWLLKKHELPLWFRALNAAAPLPLFAVDLGRHACQLAAWRWQMLKSRLRHLF